MARAVVTTKADIVHITSTPLAVLGLLHRARFHSSIVLDIQERPAAVRSKGSVTAVFARVEPFLLRQISRRVEVVTVVAHGDIQMVSAMGFRSVVLVRNAPLSNWRAPYVPPHPSSKDSLTAVVIGTIFEGRGFEILLRAIAKAKRTRDVHVKIYGPGRADYIDSLRKLTESLSIEDSVDWMGPTDTSNVSVAYLSAQVGIVLYEPGDAGNDGLSNKILECVASGRPVIAGDLPENRRFVCENGVGWLADVTVEGLSFVLANAGAGEDLGLLSARCREIGDQWLNWECEFRPVLMLMMRPSGLSAALTECT